MFPRFQQSFFLLARRATTISLTAHTTSRYIWTTCDCLEKALWRAAALFQSQSKQVVQGFLVTWNGLLMSMLQTVQLLLFSLARVQRQAILLELGLIGSKSKPMLFQVQCQILQTIDLNTRQSLQEAKFEALQTTICNTKQSLLQAILLFRQYCALF
jgi:hypothetical protein